MVDSNDNTSEQRIAAYLTGRLRGLRAAYLFGSRVTDQSRPDSDYDIAVLAESPLSGRLKLELTEALADQLGNDVDLVDLSTASTVLRSQIVGTGKLLYTSSDSERQMFEDFVYSDYARLNEERAGILADVKSRGSIHG